ncbi:MAG: DNA repair protein RecO [Acidobacteria bacterium]|nr:MAG: DNA repair protein RecO [Acidobacteriota bacterium]
MPLIETEAIVLRTHRLGEADKIASLLTRQLGRIRVVAKGALSRRGRYGAALEPLTYIRVWVYDRENRDLQRVGSAEIVESFFEMQRDYRIQLAAQYLAEVTERFLPDREVNERVFRLLLVVLRAFKRFGEVSRPLLFFDYWLLRLGGFLPDLSGCMACQRPFAGEDGFYDPIAVALVCAQCRSSTATERISVDALGLIPSFRAARIEQWIENEAAPPGTRELRRLLEQIIEAHLEKKLTTRAMLADEI